MASKLLLRRLSRVVKPSLIHRSCCRLLEHSRHTDFSENTHTSHRSLISASRNFCSCPPNLDHDSQVPSAIDYRSLLQEDEFHRLSNSTIHDLQEKFEEYGDVVQIDGFDVDYGNEVLTLKLGALGTYVLNKQTPNRQIWLSSPVRRHSLYAVVHLGLIGIRMLKLGFTDAPKLICWDFWKMSWSNCLASPSISLQTVELMISLPTVELMIL